MKRSSHGRTAGIAALLGLLTAGLGCSDSTAPVNPVQTVTKTGRTDNQQAAAGTTVAFSPEVTLLRANGEKAVGETVVFTVLSGGGSVSGGTVTTDIRGTARVGSWTLGPVAGPNTLSATANNVSVSFSAIGVPGPAADIVLAAGDEQTATVGTEVDTRPQVQAVDQYGNGVQGVTITWSVVSGGGSIVGQNTVLSEPDGYAAVGGWILGPTPGDNQLEAAATGFPTITFRATAVP